MGDVMLGRGITQAHRKGDWENTFSSIKPYLAHIDIAAANLESPITTRASINPLSYDLHAPQESITALTSAGFDILSLTNNHNLDSGESGLEDTKAILAKSNINYISSDFKPLRVVKNGIILSFLGFEDVSQPLKIDVICPIIQNEKATGAIVIISAHWGDEYHRYPNSSQKSLAQSLADCGATIIWGHHPHILQSFEWIKGRDQLFSTLVIYSLGNAIFDQNIFRETRVSLLLLVTINSQDDISYQWIPFEINPQKGIIIPADNSITNYIRQHVIQNYPVIK
jgi:poly-gamma-glutamate synthesis protein (capsule biosynthesis protein)